MSESLVPILKEIASDLEQAGSRAEAFLSDVRARTLTVTLEAVKAGVPPGKLRDAVAELRLEVSRRADELARVRLDLTRQTGIALARAASLAREAEGLNDARRVAAGIGWFFAERARELQGMSLNPALCLAVHRGEVVATGPWLRLRPGPPLAGVRLDMRGGEPILCADQLEARLPWEAVRHALILGDLGALIALSQGRLPERASAEVRVWWVDRDEVLAASHDELPPYEVGDDEGMYEVGRRSVAVAAVPATVAGMERFRLIRAPRPPGAPSSPWLPGTRGQVLRFPGV